MKKAVFAGAVVMAMLGCSRHRDEVGPTERVVSSFDTVGGLELPGDIAAPPPRGGPTGWPQTSAANPTGWADESERRCAEDLCEPTAIGGGPQQP